MAKVSVIIPAYNSQQFIAQTLDCLLRQTLKDIEVIIVNDGSTDDTQKIIDEYVSSHSIFTSYFQQNAGVSAARNSGLKKAKGEYVVFLDADDLYSDEALQAFYETAVRTGADIVIGRLATFTHGGDEKFNEYAQLLSGMESIDTFNKALLWNFLVGNKCYRREFLSENGLLFPNYRYSEEGAFFMSAVYAGARISGTRGSTMYYRRHTAEQGLSVSQTVTLPLAESFSGSLGMIYGLAVDAVKKADMPDAQKQDYLQEIIYKQIHILITQFYRLMWRSSDDCVSYCAAEIRRLRSMMDSGTLERTNKENPDINFDKLCDSKSMAAKRANITVIAAPMEADAQPLFDSLYAQTSPFFRVIAPKGMAESGKIPKRYLSNENLTLLDDVDYMKNAKKAAGSKARLIVRRPLAIDIRTFRLIYKLPIPDSIRRTFVPLIVKGLKYII